MTPFQNVCPDLPRTRLTKCNTSSGRGEGIRSGFKPKMDAGCSSWHIDLLLLRFHPAALSVLPIHGRESKSWPCDLAVFVRCGLPCSPWLQATAVKVPEEQKGQSCVQEKEAAAKKPHKSCFYREKKKPLSWCKSVQNQKKIPLYAEAFLYEETRQQFLTSLKHHQILI